MSRGLGSAFVAVLLTWTASGCSLDSFLSPAAVVKGPKTVADGSVSRVTARLQDGLSDAGIWVRMNRVGSDVRLAGIAKSGKVFCLHLYAKKDGGGKKTLVCVQWDRGGDEELWRLIHEILTQPESDDSSPSAVSLAIPTDQQNERGN